MCLFWQEFGSCLQLDWYDFTEAAKSFFSNRIIQDFRRYQSLAALPTFVVYLSLSNSNVVVSISAHQAVRFGQLSLEIVHSGLGVGIFVTSLPGPVSGSLLPEYRGVSSYIRSKDSKARAMRSILIADHSSWWVVSGDDSSNKFWGLALYRTGAEAWYANTEPLFDSHHLVYCITIRGVPRQK
jgi:hypothetical protein